MGQTFVIVTHDEELAKLTDRTIHIVDGRISEDPTGKRLLNTKENDTTGKL